MALKRNSRVFVDEAAHAQEGKQMPTTTPMRSRRSSSSYKDDNPSQAESELAELPSSRPIITEATSMARSSSTSAASVESSISTEELPMPLSGRVVTEFTQAMRATAIMSQPSEHPVAPLTGRPDNFGIVIPGIYRSSYPKGEDFEYIKSLGLKTIVTLVKKDDPDLELESFVSREGIRQVIFNMKGTKKQAIPLETMQSILSVVLDKENYPLLIHCNHGKHRTGCVVGLVRKLSGWDTERAVIEYRSFAEPKIRECDVEYLTTFQTSTLHSAIKDAPIFGPAKINTFFRALFFSAFVLSLWLLSGSKMTALTRRNGLL